MDLRPILNPLEEEAMPTTTAIGASTQGPSTQSDYPSTQSNVSRRASQKVIDAIETMVDKIMGSLQAQEELCIELRRRSVCGEGEDARWYKVRFPARTADEAWRFAVVVRILELVHEAQVDNLIVSKRNIYYADPSLFKTQSVVDRYLDILAFTFGVGRGDLNVTAAAKGLVIGGFKMTYSESRVVTQTYAMDAALIPDTYDVAAVDTGRAAWVLVVEKESTFRTLTTSMLHSTNGMGAGIILTAKGYPDISTRRFLHLLASPTSNQRPPLPIFALVDFDPDGLAILSTYKHGSQNLAHENASLNVRGIRWLGVRSEDALAPELADGLLRMSARDRKKARDMLEKMDEDGTEQEGRRDLQVMLMLNRKAEMEILNNRAGGVGKWVEDRMVQELNNAEDIMDI